MPSHDPVGDIRAERDEGNALGQTFLGFARRRHRKWNAGDSKTGLKVLHPLHQRVAYMQAHALFKAIHLRGDLACKQEIPPIKRTYQIQTLVSLPLDHTVYLGLGSPRLHSPRRKGKAEILRIERKIWIVERIVREDGAPIFGHPFALMLVA